MTRVKICGIKEKSHALGASSAGADFIGLVLAPSPRQVTVAQAQEIVSAIKERSKATETVIAAHDLLFCFPANYRLKVTDNHRVGVGSHH
ncbi:unnamed protein product [marine sediment metagenome]|uniref:Phosphoribosylanthranilate isomerase n=1 Tax=marine sediment metagenome TaxID=412755 RepID=X1T205_9ZZZZ